MTNFAEILSAFPKSREERLRAIRRFSMSEVFLYRSTLWCHELRVAALTAELSKLAEGVLPGYDAKKAFALALVHDDAEVVTGDVQAGHKLLMSESELQKVHDDEANAIEVLAKEFSETVGGYTYKDLLYHALHKDCVEAQVVSYADKVDAYCESMHDVFGGNLLSLRSVIFYVEAIPKLKKKYVALAPLFERTDSPLINLDLRTDPWKGRWSSYAHLNKPHTVESMQHETEFPFYNACRKIVLDSLGDEGMEFLTTKLETL